MTEVSAEDRSEILDEEHLRLLTIAHYVTGGFAIAFSCLFILYSFLFLLLARRPDLFRGSSGGEAPPPEIMGLFAIFFGMFVFAGWTFGGLTIYAGYCIKKRIHRTLTLVVACFNAAWFPIGSILGVSTLMVLTRTSVKRLFSAPTIVGRATESEPRGGHEASSRESMN
jgi:hypothetical protein